MAASVTALKQAIATAFENAAEQTAESRANISEISQAMAEAIIAQLIEAINSSTITHKLLMDGQPDLITGKIEIKA